MKEGAVSLCMCMYDAETEREKSVSGWVSDVSVCLCGAFADPSVVRGGTSQITHRQAGGKGACSQLNQALGLLECVWGCISVYM